MTYFDTDVLVNAILIQDLDRHNRALSRIEKSIKDDSFIISSVTLQELVFVLGKLKIESVVIRKTYEFYSPLAPRNMPDLLSHLTRMTSENSGNTLQYQWKSLNHSF